MGAKSNVCPWKKADFLFPQLEGLHCIIIFFYLVYFIDYVITALPHFHPLPTSAQYPLPSSNPLLSSCPWVMHVSSLSSPFPLLFSISPCLFCTYQLHFLICTFPPILLVPADNPPNDLHTFGSVSVLVVCLGFFNYCYLFVCFQIQLLVAVNLLPF